MKVASKNSQENLIPEIQLSYKFPVPFASLPEILTAKDAYDVLISRWDMDRIDLVEQFKVVFINRASRLLGIYEVSSGSTVGTLADPKLIFAAALKSAASGIILAHNHPSGDPTPSALDIVITQKLKACAELLEIEFLDHLIVTRERFYSMVGEDCW